MEDKIIIVEKYKEGDENPTSWKLRKHFLITHYDKFPENRLVCLSKCYINVKIDGCKYPGPVMTQLHELSKELGEGL